MSKQTKKELKKELLIRDKVILEQSSSIKDYLLMIDDIDIAIEKLANMYESQLKVQDFEIRRLNIIIDNYETKLKITVKED